LCARNSVAPAAVATASAEASNASPTQAKGRSDLNCCYVLFLFLDNL